MSHIKVSAELLTKVNWEMTVSGAELRAGFRYSQYVSIMVRSSPRLAANDQSLPW
jgi:hypothetical protein